MYCRNCRQALNPKEVKRAWCPARLLACSLVTVSVSSLFFLLPGARGGEAAFLTLFFGGPFALLMLYVFIVAVDPDWLHRHVCPVCLLPLTSEHPAPQDLESSVRRRMCGQCGHENVQAARHCAHCGSPLAVTEESDGRG